MSTFNWKQYPEIVVITLDEISSNNSRKRQQLRAEISEIPCEKSLAKIARE